MSKGGFTLIELLVSIVILGLIIAAIYGVLNIDNITYNLDMGLLDLQQQARQTMYLMVKELREATGINISVITAQDNEITFNTSQKSGVKYYRDIDDNNNDGIINQIINEYPAGNYKILANDISNLNFCCWHDSICDADCSDSDMLQVQLKAKKTVGQKELSFPFAEGIFLIEKVKLRNE